ncbi:MAG: PAS domain S-box protein [bacterium]|nr:PAS domain S-box protein [bacterium]
MSSKKQPIIPLNVLGAQILDAVKLSDDNGVIAYLLSGQIVFWNRGAEQIYGYSSSEALGKNFMNLVVAKENRNKFQMIIKRVLKGERVSEHSLLRRTKSGAHKFVSLTASGLRDNAGKIIGVLSIARDVSEQLKTYQDKLRMAASVESSEDAIYGRDLSGRITSWNEGAEKIYGYSREEVLGKDSKLIFPENSKGQYNKLRESIKRDEAIRNFETVRVRKGGKRIMVSLTVSPIKDDRGNIIGCSVVARDITEKKIAEQSQEMLSKASKLLASSLDYGKTLKEIARLIVPKLADWFAIDLIVDGKREMAVLAHQDPKMVKLALMLRTKYPLNESSGASRVMKTGKAEFYPVITSEMIEAHAKDAEHLRLIKKIGFSSAIVVPLKVHSTILGAMTLVYSTAGKHYTQADPVFLEELARRIATAIDNARHYATAEHELSERSAMEEKLRQFIESTSDAFVSFDKEWRYTYMNKNAEYYEGVKFEDVQGKVIWEMFPESRNKLFYEKYHEVMKARKKIEFEEFLQNKWFEIRAYPVKDGGIALHYNDITGRKLDEQRKDEFISMASHELKTPITSIKLYTELLLKKVKDKTATQHLSSMFEQVNRLSKLINDLLDVSRIQAGKLIFKKQFFDLGLLIADIAEILGKTSKKHSIITSVHLAGKVWGDKDRVGQVIINLIGNAIKYSPSGGDIIIVASKIKDNVIVNVQDFGIGLYSHDKDRIFERFYQIKGGTFPGLGIGLYIAKMIVEGHGGKIEVKSRVNEGSTFIFTLPQHMSM